MKIENATIDDAAGLVELVKVLGYEADALEVNQRLEKILKRDDHCVLVAREGSEVIGFCHGYVRFLLEVKEAVEIGGLAVRENWQGKGVARKMIEALESWITDKRFDYVVLKSNIKRIKAHGFYEHVGYRKASQQFAFEKLLIKTQ